MLKSSTSQHVDIFNLAKTIPAHEVSRRFGLNLQKKGRHWMARCPFHEDKTPSFSLYRGRFKCFGCGWSGDAVDLVGEMLHLEPLDAAREIARSFGLDDGQGKALKRGALLKYQRERREKQEIEAAFREWRKRTFYGLSIYLRACENILGGSPDDPGYAVACHLQPKFEYLFEVLSGPIEDQVKLFEEYGWEWVI